MWFKVAYKFTAPEFDLCRWPPLRAGTQMVSDNNHHLEHLERVPPSEGFSLLHLCILIALVYGLQVGVLRLVKLWSPESNWLKLAIIAQQAICILLPVIGFIILHRLPAREALGAYKPIWYRTVIAVVGGFFLMMIINLTLPRLIPPSQAYAESGASIVAYEGFSGLLLTVLAISIVAPLADELFFRGIILRSLMARFGTLGAILIVAALTALFHKLEPMKLTHSFIMGVIFAASVVWTRSVFTSLILHGIHNSLSLLPQAWVMRVYGLVMSMLGLAGSEGT
jgi:membrane protease YdiL (CAAX protease family)